MEARIGVPEPHSIGTLGRDLGPDPDRDFWLDLDPYETNLDPKNCPLGSLLYIRGGIKIKLEYFNKKTMVRVRKVFIS
jgi:hypothetical protein